MRQKYFVGPFQVIPFIWLIINLLYAGIADRYRTYISSFHSILVVV